MSSNMLYMAYDEQMKKKLNDIPSYNSLLRTILLVGVTIKASLITYMIWTQPIYFFVTLISFNLYGFYFHLLILYSSISNLMTIAGIGFTSEWLLLFATISETLIAINYFNIVVYFTSMGLYVFGWDQMMAISNFMHFLMVGLFIVSFPISFGCLSLYKQIKARNQWLRNNRMVWSGGQPSETLSNEEAQAVKDKADHILYRTAVNDSTQT